MANKCATTTRKLANEIHILTVRFSREPSMRLGEAHAGCSMQMLQLYPVEGASTKERDISSRMFPAHVATHDERALSGWPPSRVKSWPWVGYGSREMIQHDSGSSLYCLAAGHTERASGYPECSDRKFPLAQQQTRRAAFADKQMGGALSSCRVTPPARPRRDPHMHTADVNTSPVLLRHPRLFRVGLDECGKLLPSQIRASLCECVCLCVRQCGPFDLRLAIGGISRRDQR